MSPGPCPVLAGHCRRRGGQRSTRSPARPQRRRRGSRRPSGRPEAARPSNDGPRRAPAPGPPQARRLDALPRPQRRAPEGDPPPARSRPDLPRDLRWGSGPAMLPWPCGGSAALLSLPSAPGFGSLGRSFLIENLLAAPRPLPLPLRPAAAAAAAGPQPPNPSRCWPSASAAGEPPLPVPGRSAGACSAQLGPLSSPNAQRAPLGHDRAAAGQRFKAAHGRPRCRPAQVPRFAPAGAPPNSAARPSVLASVSSGRPAGVPRSPALGRAARKPAPRSPVGLPPGRGWTGGQPGWDRKGGRGRCLCRVSSSGRPTSVAWGGHRQPVRSSVRVRVRLWGDDLPLPPLHGVLPRGARRRLQPWSPFLDREAVRLPGVHSTPRGWTCRRAPLRFPWDPAQDAAARTPGPADPPPPRRSGPARPGSAPGADSPARRDACKPGVIS